MPHALILTSTFPRWEGDATPRFVRDLALAATPDWDVTVLAPHHPGAAREERMGPLDVRRFVYFRPSAMQKLCYGGGILPNAKASALARVQVPGLFAAAARALEGLLRERTYDLVHAHFLVPLGLVASLVLRGRAPLVVSAHGSDVFALRGRAAKKVHATIIARAAIATVNGEPMREAIGPSPKVRVLPMAVDTDVFVPSGRARDPKKILFVGRLSPQKGLRVLVEALDRLPGTRLEIAGAGPEEVAHPRARYLGPLGAREVASVMREAAAVVVPSLGFEAQGLVALEAMATETPVVASRTGGLADAIGDEARGWLAEPGEAGSLARAIERCLADPAEATRRAREARAFVLERFSPPAIRERLLAIYDEARRWD